MDAEQLFLARCSQLSRLLESHDQIELLDLSAILRQLLLNDHPLVHKANTEQRIKLKFHVGHFRRKTDPFVLAQTLEDGLDPETRLPGSPASEVNLDGFLNHPVLYLKGEPHSVKDVVLFTANVAGGVHHTATPKDAQLLLAEFARRFGIGGLPAGIRQLRAIARVTLKGLQPLIDVLGSH